LHPVNEWSEQRMCGKCSPQPGLTEGGAGACGRKEGEPHEPQQNNGTSRTIRGGKVANHMPKSARGATVFGWLFHASIRFAVLWFALLLYALLISALMQVG